MKVKFTRVDNDALMPTRACEGDAGLDLTALVSCNLMPGEIAQVRTGIAVEVPPGYVGFVFARSGYSSRGIALANGVGVIDSGYRGELLVLLQNSSAQPHHIGAGSRIAQFIVMHVPFFEVLEVDELSDSERGEGGFGHSGD